MKFMLIIEMEPSRGRQIAKPSDMILSITTDEIKRLAIYTLLSPIPGQDPSHLRAIAIIDTESEEALYFNVYSLLLAGASSVNVIPVKEQPIS